MSKDKTSMTREGQDEATLKVLTISKPHFETAIFNLESTAPYVQSKFAEKAKQKMMAKMTLGDQAKKNRKKEPRDFEDDYLQAMHFSEEGWHGMPAAAYRAGLISACRIVGFAMTRAKLALFVEADRIDKLDGMPLIKIEGEPQMVKHYVRLPHGETDIRVRAMWKKWSAEVRVRYDADMFSFEDVGNLMDRVGTQVGIGEGRPDSKSSPGMGWGTFRIC